MLGGNVVPKVPVSRMILTIRTLRWETDHREYAHREEATAVVAPEIL